jgi:hypothetical protein
MSAYSSLEYFCQNRIVLSVNLVFLLKKEIQPACRHSFRLAIKSPAYLRNEIVKLVSPPKTPLSTRLVGGMSKKMKKIVKQALLIAMRPARAAQSRSLNITQTLQQRTTR